MAIEFLEILAHDDGGFHEQATHPERISIDLFDLVDHFLNANLDPNVVHLIAVVGTDNVHQVFANVVHITFDGGKNKLSFGAALTCGFHELFKVGYGHFHGLCALQHERQLHTPRTKEFSHFAHSI